MQHRGEKDKMYSGYEIWKLMLEVFKVQIFRYLSDAKSLGKPLALPSDVLDLFSINNGRIELTDTT